MSTLLQKIEDGSATIAVVGAGYVGLPFAVESGRAGIQTTVYDIAADKIAEVNAGRSYIGDVPSEVLAPLVQTGIVTGSTDPAVLGAADAVVICVPTPLRKTKDPDVSMILAAGEAVAAQLRPGQLIVLESTTYPGFTREVLRGQLEARGLKVGEDFYLSFSPERVDPGNPTYQTKNTPKVIGGMTAECTRVTCALYEKFLDHLVPVSCTDAAEMVKLLENTFRAVNIGLVNEVALMCAKLGIDTWEVIGAAATKPFGFMPFFPGPGLGGHCIPVDPHYLSWKLKTLKYNARFVELAGEINSNMPVIVTQLIASALNDHEKPVKNSKIMILGVAYKPDIDDVRESPALDVIELLRQRGGDISYHDPHVPRFAVGPEKYESVSLDRLGEMDAVVIITHHNAFDYLRICQQSQLVIDTRNATRAIRADFPGKIVML